MSVTIFGATVDVGAGYRGAALGPAALRIAGLCEGLSRLGIPVEDLGDLLYPGPIDEVAIPNAHGSAQVAGWTRSIANRTEAILTDGTTPVVLGGDHTISIGSVEGALRAARRRGQPLVVLWLDAHADFNTPETTPSGNMHGMALAALAGEAGLESVFGDTARQPLPVSDIHLFGCRSIDRGERALLVAKGANIVDMRHIDEKGIVGPLGAIIDTAVAREAMVHVSLDVDFLDPSVAPGVGTTVPGGATFREAHLAMEMLHDSHLVTSMDVVELNPFLDDRGRSAFVLVDLVLSLFGQQILDRRAMAQGR